MLLIFQVRYFLSNIFQVIFHVKYFPCRYFPAHSVLRALRAPLEGHKRARHQRARHPDINGARAHRQHFQKRTNTISTISTRAVTQTQYPLVL